uniref:class I SAM-dependent methyltransferase n=1 Tax=Altererythrobacter segetis TaxID=1104773 RepID=UPI00140CFCCF|nr:class I SAM-dependent methyltransferase [Altererythrobacter segetis]
MSQNTKFVGNVDSATVAGFGDEWDTYDQHDLSPDDFARTFDRYFHIFPFASLRSDAEGFDLGCGSGRWAEGIADRVGRLHCIDPAPKALAVARRRLAGKPSPEFHQADAGNIPLRDESQDFGYSLGVLHHIPDTKRALADCVRKLKHGAPFLIYLYYRFDSRPWWFRCLWRISDLSRRAISRLPFSARKSVALAIAAAVYWPMARSAAVLERAGVDVAPLPLSFYRNLDFYWMKTDALDRFGTRLEHRFTRLEIERMMTDAGLRDIRFSDREPFWVAVGIRA